MNLPVFNKDMAAADLDLLMTQARKASDLLKALSHEVRLVILCLLSEGEKSVSELEEILTMPQAAVSQQLARLRLEGLVESRRDGRMIYYSLVDDEVSGIISSLYDLFCKDVRSIES
ncbi:ArsR/SmtB family transcription factor [Roseibium marinum]|uniref:DNA-binding transcriptional ArsR family regulator n=1 Tax=Roseibium marinum TaxID=281252 RepID=A0A2S3V1V7_9HYPH|nr:metalloregulator ArsR/SmtB family transcription factor [Roseibium marinum]POF33669.1 DNA-binding transcriptional ArsR family regulator [Roseibium marinum]